MDILTGGHVAKVYKIKTLIGQRFERLVVLKRKGNNKEGRALWEVLCDCGNHKIVTGSNLRRGQVKSCGCLARDNGKRMIKINCNPTRHGLTGTKTHNTWAGMRARCRNIKDTRYGGRGITVCKRWEKFENFFTDMGIAPEGKSLNRIDNNKGYSPENCEWTTSIIQANNRRSNVLITYHRETKTLAQWARDLNVSYKNFHKRLRSKKWSFGKAAYGG